MRFVPFAFIIACALAGCADSQVEPVHDDDGDDAELPRFAVEQPSFELEEHRCTWDGECRDGLRCAMWIGDGDGVCVKDECDDGGGCGDGFVCRKSTRCSNACVPVIAENDNCFHSDDACFDFDTPCADGLECAHTMFAPRQLGFCQEPGGVGTFCNDIEPKQDGCADQLACMGYACTATPSCASTTAFANPDGGGAILAWGGELVRLPYVDEQCSGALAFSVGLYVRGAYEFDELDVPGDGLKFSADGAEPTMSASSYVARNDAETGDYCDGSSDCRVFQMICLDETPSDFAVQVTDDAGGAANALCMSIREHY